MPTVSAKWTGRRTITITSEKAITLTKLPISHKMATAGTVKMP